MPGVEGDLLTYLLASRLTCLPPLPGMGFMCTKCGMRWCLYEKVAARGKTKPRPPAATGGSRQEPLRVSLAAL